MITVKIDENTLLDMLLDRVISLTDDDDVINLYEEYYTNLIDYGYFDNSEFNPKLIVDDDYINNLVAISSDELSNYDINLEKDKNTDKIEAYLENKDLYLIRTY